MRNLMMNNCGGGGVLKELKRERKRKLNAVPADNIGKKKPD